MARTAYAAALLALSQPAAAQLPAFPCATLADEGQQIFEGIGPTADRRSSAPVMAKKKALLAREQFPLVTRWLTFDDAGLATDGGKLFALPFRAYRIAGEARFCSQASRDSIFGPRNRDGTYLLRCLFDEDGDGRFESFRAHGELVPYNNRTGRTGAPTGIVPPLRPLPQPVRLVESAAARDPNPGFAPRLVVETRIAALTASELLVDILAEVAILPDGIGVRARGGEAKRLSIPLREGSHPLDFGRNLVLTRKGDAWQAAISGDAAAPAELQCGGSVVAAGGSFSILTEGGLLVVPADRLPAS